jgi:F-type H+-transporting ATPase subunit gamma
MNLRQVKKKIKTIGNVKKITRAMELVAAVKMKKSQQEAIEGRPYHQTLENMIKKITAMISPDYSPLLNTNTAEKKLGILISTNKGLCGAFNFNLFRYFVETEKNKNNEYITLGKKGAFFLNRLGAKVIADFSEGKFLLAVSAVFDLIINKFLSKECSEVSLIYNKFISPVKYIPVKEVILPLKLTDENQNQEVKKLTENFEIEPDPEQIIDPLLKSFIEEKIREAIISSEAGEHSARMLAMKNATDNASDLIFDLTLAGNKLRQEKITNELLDMITAKESVEN